MQRENRSLGFTKGMASPDPMSSRIVDMNQSNSFPAEVCEME